jgi:hypothetical protein
MLWVREGYLVKPVELEKVVAEVAGLIKASKAM